MSDQSQPDYEKKEKHHKHMGQLGKIGAVAAGAYALVPQSTSWNDVH